MELDLRRETLRLGTEDRIGSWLLSARRGAGPNMLLAWLPEAWTSWRVVNQVEMLELPWQSTEKRI